MLHALRGNRVNGERQRKKNMKPVQFAKEVQNEAKKVTWPSRKETMISTIMVFIMVVIIALFLYFADQIIAWLISLIL